MHTSGCKKRKGPGELTARWVRSPGGRGGARESDWSPGRSLRANPAAPSPGGCGRTARALVLLHSGARPPPPGQMLSSFTGQGWNRALRRKPRHVVLGKARPQSQFPQLSNGSDGANICFCIPPRVVIKG